MKFGKSSSLRHVWS